MRWAWGWPVAKVGAWTALTAAATVCSLAIQRPYRGVVGNLCERTVENPSGYCFEDLPAGGFPFAYLYDSPSTSVIGQLGVEDAIEFQKTVHMWALLGDLAFFGGLVWGVWRLVVWARAQRV